MIVSWLQPPQVLLQMCDNGMRLIAEETYASMLKQLSCSLPNEITLESKILLNSNLKSFRKQAFIRRLSCSIDEFSEMFWRFWTKDFTGKNTLFNWHKAFMTLISPMSFPSSGSFFPGDSGLPPLGTYVPDQVSFISRKQKWLQDKKFFLDCFCSNIQTIDLNI